MKSNILVTLCLAIGLVSCSSCSKKDQTVPVTPTPVSSPSCSESSCPSPVPPPSASASTPEPGPVLVKQDNWQFTLPEPGWTSISTGEDGIKAALINKDRGNMVIFVKEPFTGTVEEYALTAIRGIKQAGGTFVSATNVSVNGMKSVLVESTKAVNGDTSAPLVRIWVWTFVSNKSGYALSCGGRDDELNTQKALCASIASSVKID